ncbi:glycosyltransferase [Eubacterium oxidoreducens]|uniref:Glycosyltransferase involved in cell wall bisynthesis n=1 Tax=Eubacterium oxidoreducens TaxID=1732 RepID=A0A1G6CNR9_EUBOX|nr:glycosyltransferase [Eubacterium oxidoreducens]SDB34541.1 Glycosyltransferase involved in cell wall bisynthesis [Eubacterium oxidoreducens]
MNLSIILSVQNDNVEELQKSLDSLLNQSLEDIELLCVVKKGLADVQGCVQAYKEKDSRVVLLESEGNCLGDFRNTALKKAQGDYVLLFESGDIVLDYAVEAVYHKAVKYNTDVLRFMTVIYDDDKKIYRKFREYLLSELRPGDVHRSVSLEKDSLLYDKDFNHEAWTGIYKRAFIQEQGITFGSYPYGIDLDFYYQTLLKSSNTMYCMDRVAVRSLDKLIISKDVESFKGYADDYGKTINFLLQKVEDLCIECGLEKKKVVNIVNLEMRRFFDLCMKYYKTVEEEGYLDNDADLINAEENEDELSDEQAEDLQNLWIKETTERFARKYEGKYKEALYRHYLMNEKRRIDGCNKEYALPKKYKLYHKQVEKQPKVTVVIPTMNVEDYLNLALDSLTHQTLEKCEFIILNDGSTDHSMVIMQEYAAVDKRFVIVDKPNSGYGNSMNIGIDKARGEYLGILEPDDFVPVKMFEELYRVCKINELDFVKADFIRFTVNPDGSLMEKYNRLTGKKKYYNKVINTSEERETFKFIMNTWSGIYSVDFLNKYQIRHNETPGASYQDNGFYFQTFAHGQRVMFINRPYYMNRRDNPNSSMFSKKKERCITQEYQFIGELLEKQGIKETYSDIYWRKKYGNFMMTYRRLSEDLKPGYLHHICDEFKDAVNDGTVTEEVLGLHAWKQLNEILADPDAFYEKLRVSVIIPVYNGAKYIGQCLDTILLWNEIRIEVIVVDDGSTDNTVEIIREYEAKDSRVKVITQQNAGAGAARNNGLQYAKGEYLSFLDADDFFEYDMLRKAYDRAYTYEADVVVFRSDEFYENTHQYRDIPYTINANLLPKKRPFTMDEVSHDVFKLCVGWAWDKLFKREFVLENHLLFQEQRTTNDMLFVFSALIKAQSIVINSEILAHHRKVDDSLSVTREKSWDCFYKALLALREQLKTWGLYERYEQDFINYCQHFTLWNLESIQGEAYFKLYEKIKNEWLEELGVYHHEEDYFYNQSEYERLHRVLELDAQDYLFFMLEHQKQMVKAEKLKNSQANKNKEIEINKKVLLHEKKLYKKMKKLSSENKEKEPSGAKSKKKSFWARLKKA